MIAISAKNIKKEYLTKVILDDVTFNINVGDKVALIGANGSGKTTLFRILTKQISQDSGEFFTDRNSTVGYLSQNLNLDSQKSIYDETLTVFKNLLDIEEKIRKIEIELSSPYDPSKEEEHLKLAQDYTLLHDLYINRGGETYRAETSRVLTGLGINESMWNKQINLLSGGEKTRVAIAKLLLAHPDILLMDEPTNHLDLKAIEWLEEFLKSYKGTLLIISHDRFFLDAVTNRTFLLAQGSVLTYNAPYTKYLELYKADYEAKLKAYEIQQDEIKRQEAIIEKFKSFNREKSIKAAESRQKRLDKIERIEAPKKDGKAAGISFSAEYVSANNVLIVDRLTKRFPDKTLFKDLSFIIKRGDKKALVGENGTGKTTLFNIIKGSIKADEGKTILGENVTFGYYDQMQSDLSLDKTILDEIWDDFPHLTTTELRTYLGTFLFKGDDVFKEISLLSGGEKARINLLKLMLRKDNFLLLDEPTNHLDIPSREALEDSLINYDGTLLVISHDRYFLNKVINQILELKDSKIKMYPGNYSYYIEKKKEEINNIVPIDKTKDSELSESALSRKEKKENSRNKTKTLNQIKKIEEQVSKKESEIISLNEDLTKEEVFTDGQKTKDTLDKISILEQEIEELMIEWEELQS